MQKLITNTGNSPMYHGNTMIPPGESRLVDVPGDDAKPQEAAAPTLVDLLTELLGKSIAAITPEIQKLTHEALEKAYEMEQEGKNRSTLLAALQDEIIRRADEQLRQDEADRNAKALAEARAELAAAIEAQEKLPADASETDRSAAKAAVDEAQAKVDVLTPED